MRLILPDRRLFYSLHACFANRVWFGGVLCIDAGPREPQAAGHNGEIAVRILTEKDPESLDVMRHSCADVMARHNDDKLLKHVVELEGKRSSRVP